MTFSIQSYNLNNIFKSYFLGQRKFVFTLAEVFSTLFAGQRKFAFTLAEVLITLGIIGIVASMTLPVVIKNFRAVVLENQFKKQYSVLSQVLMQMYQEEGIDLTPSDLGVSAFVAGLKEHYHIIKDCGRVGINTKGCIQLDPTEEDRYNISVYKNFVGGSINFGYIDDGVLLTNDGVTLLLEIGSQASAFGYFLVGIDVNGFKNKPNKFGHDVFIFRIGAKGKLMDTNESPPYLRVCNTTSTDTSNGYGCAIRALSERDYFKNLPK